MVPYFAIPQNWEIYWILGYWYIRNDPNFNALKKTNIYYLIVSLGQKSGCSLACLPGLSEATISVFTGLWFSKGPAGHRFRCKLTYAAVFMVPGCVSP